MENTPKAIPENCMYCDFSEVIPDPDPYDWFCDDDCAVICKKSKKSITFIGHNYKCVEPMITVGCRPYNTTKECSVPDWCPLKDMK